MFAPLTSSTPFRPFGCGLPRSAGQASRVLPPTPLTGQAREIGIERCLHRPWDLPGRARDCRAEDITMRANNKRCGSRQAGADSGGRTGASLYQE
ncbi:hypothetical protein EN829_031660, partial [Mesorhizobium sp. M00.F.Ca.ET.186.01.1.1]